MSLKSSETSETHGSRAFTISEIACTSHGMLLHGAYMTSCTAYVEIAGLLQDKRQVYTVSEFGISRHGSSLYAHIYQ